MIRAGGHLLPTPHGTKIDMTDPVSRYGTQAWRYLGWTPAGLAAIKRFKARALAAGMTSVQVEALWADVELDQMLAPAPFDALREAQRRLLVWVAG